MSFEMVDFHGDKVAVTITSEGKKMVAMRPICENIGLDWSSQRKKIQADEVLKSTVVIITMVAADGKERKISCIPLEYLTGWLFKISPSKVAPEIRNKVIQYQVECYRVLHDYWSKGMALAPSVVKEVVEDPEVFLAKALMYANEKINKQRSELDLKIQELEVARPKAEFYDKFADADGLHSLTSAAKLLNISGITLGRFVRERGWAWEKVPLTWKHPFIKEGYGATKAWTRIDDNTGEIIKTGVQSMFTSKGLVYVLEKYEAKQKELEELYA